MSASPTERPRPGQCARAGFTLIETLVAFAALAMALAVALPLLASGLRGVDTADRRLLALALAESKLADAIGAWPPPFGTSEGTDTAEQRWRLRVEPVATAPGRTPRLARYEVMVASPGEALDDGVRLLTWRLITRDAP